jgi:hypothetical protein
VIRTLASLLAFWSLFDGSTSRQLPLCIISEVINVGEGLI